MLPLGYPDPNMDPSCCELLLVNGVNSCAYDAGYETDHTALSPPSSDGTGWESEGDICSVGGCCASGMIQTMHPMRSTSYFYVEDRRPQQTTAVYHACVAPENESSTFHDSQAAQKLSGDVNREDFVASNGVVYDLGSDIRGAMMEGMDCCTVITDQHHQYHDVPMLTGPQGQSSTQFCAAGTTCIHSEGPQESCCQSSEGMIENGAFEPCCSMLYNHEPYYGAKHTTSSRDQLCRPVATVQFDINQEGVMFSRDWQKVESPCERIEVVGASQLSSMATQDACHYVQINKAPFEDDDCASYLRIDDDEDYWSRRRYSQKEAERVLGPVDDDHLLEVGANGLSLSPVPSPIPPDTPPSLYDMSSETMLAPGFHQAGGADEDIGRGTLLQWTTEELLEESSNGSSSLSEPSTPSMGQTSPSSFSPNPHQVRDYICRWKHCWLKFEGQTELVNHIEARHVEGKARKGDEFICSWEDCPRKKKPFNARYKLLIHMRVHSGEKPNKCQHPGCSQAFSRLENLKIHMRSHTGERPYVCQYPKCPKAFSNSSDRAKHQRTHIDTRPYACTYGECGKRYTDPSSLRKHMKNHPTTMTLGLQQEYSSHYPMSNYCQEEDYTLGPSAMSHQW